MMSVFYLFETIGCFCVQGQEIVRTAKIYDLRKSQSRRDEPEQMASAKVNFFLDSTSHLRCSLPAIS